MGLGTLSTPVFFGCSVVVENFRIWRFPNTFRRLWDGFGPSFGENAGTPAPTGTHVAAAMPMSPGPWPCLLAALNSKGSHTRVGLGTFFFASKSGLLRWPDEGSPQPVLAEPLCARDPSLSTIWFPFPPVRCCVGERGMRRSFVARPAGYFLAQGGTSCSEACGARQQTCDVGAVVSAAASVARCKGIIEGLGKTPQTGAQYGDDDSGCTYHPGQSGWAQVMRQDGPPTCDAVNADHARQRVCACHSSGTRPAPPFPLPPDEWPGDAPSTADWGRWGRGRAVLTGP